MNLMTQSTTFVQLDQKYHHFTAPTVRITVDGVEIIQKLGARVADISVELTCEFPASGCSFNILEEYEYKESDFNRKGVFKQLQIGAVVEVELGYIDTETIFYGLIAEICYEFDEESNAPYIHVECVDAKFVLMKNRRLEIFNENKPSQVVDMLLSQQPVSRFIKGKAIERISGEKQVFLSCMESDYDFLVHQAIFYGFEFFILEGKAYFRKTPIQSVPILHLSTKDAIRSATVSVRGNKLVDRISVTGINPANNKKVFGNALLAGKFSAGGSAKKVLTGSSQSFFDQHVTSEQIAGERAKVIMKDINNDFGRIFCQCIGLPELIPGRFVNISGLMKEANGIFYILNVRHTFDQTGFSTKIEMRFGSL